MNEKELAEFLKYSRSDELYIIDIYNKLVLLKCPFIVIVIEEVDVYKIKDLVEVEQVQVTYDELITVYIIEGRAYYYFYFDILINKQS